MLGYVPYWKSSNVHRTSHIISVDGSTDLWLCLHIGSYKIKGVLIKVKKGFVLNFPLEYKMLIVGGWNDISVYVLYIAQIDVRYIIWGCVII